MARYRPRAGNQRTVGADATPPRNGTSTHCEISSADVSLPALHCRMAQLREARTGPVRRVRKLRLAIARRCAVAGTLRVLLAEREG